MTDYTEENKGMLAKDSQRFYPCFYLRYLFDEFSYQGWHRAIVAIAPNEDHLSVITLFRSMVLITKKFRRHDSPSEGRRK